MQKKSQSLPRISIKSNQSLALPPLSKYKPSTLHAITDRPTIAKNKRSQILLKQIKPYNKEDSDLQSDGDAVMGRLNSPKRGSMVQVVILKKNENKKDYLKNQFVKESFIGQQAVKKFYDRYKKVEKAKQMDNFMKEDNPITRIVDLLQCHNFAPRKLDIIKLKGSQTILDLRKLGLGQGSMGPVIAQLVDYMGKFDSVDLSYNRIDRLLSQNLIQKLGKVSTINLSHNRIGKVGCTKLAQLFLTKTTNIIHLNLQDNYLLDSAGIYLADNLLYYKNLRYLNLSKNHLSIKFATKMKIFLLGDKNLQQLYLSWNQFTQKATRSIFEGLSQNYSLKVFDYSWNSISPLNTDVVAKFIQKNDSIVHLDLAFCDIQKKQTQQIATALQKNNTIYGLHFEGNSGYIDFKGYLKQTQLQHFQYPLPVVRGLIRRIDGVKPYNVFNQFKQNTSRDVCWICHSWQEAKFKVNIQKYPSATQCFIHLQHQNYVGTKMDLSQDGKDFELLRMCPIMRVRFFFTIAIGPGQKMHVISEDFQSHPFNQILKFTIGYYPLQAQIVRINSLQVQYQVDPLTQDFKPNIQNVPRSTEVQVKFYQQQQIAYKQKKKVKVSVRRKVVIEQKMNIQFRQVDQNPADNAFLLDSSNRDNDQNFLRQCLEFDIANSKISKILKKNDDMQMFKKLMDSDLYKDFKDSYYYLANSNPNLVGIYSISQFVFDSFLEEQKYVTKKVNRAKIMVKLYSCLSAGDQDSSPQKKGQPTKLFSRPQLLQFMVRLAIQKWCTTPPKSKFNSQKQKEEQKKDQQKDDQDNQQGLKKVKVKLPLPLIEGIQKTMKTLSKFAIRHRSSNWRTKKYLKIELYTVNKGYQTVMMAIYQKYTGIRAKVGKPKKLSGFMVLDQFKAIFIDTDIKRNKQAMKQAQVCFLDAKRVQIQDGNTAYGLNYEQFLQCFARFSETVWFAPVAAQKLAVWDFQPNRKYVPLFIRHQSLIINVYKRMVEIQNPRMSKIVEKGMFSLQMQVMPDMVQRLALRTYNNVSFKINTIALEDDRQDEITFKSLVETLKDKYKDAVVRRQEYVDDVQERQQY